MTTLDPTRPSASALAIDNGLSKPSATMSKS